ncbi:MAG: TrpB-like pyridoxal phosphate-dependent enzyme [Firmicutes bacterium]|nr:TrpB-like pyridoxal phosphate-dependent enzyme [Bacillota bacterium]
MEDTYKIILDEKDIPKRWYNIQADFPQELEPPVHPATLRPLEPSDMKAIFPDPIIEQEISRERWIDIPAEVLDILKIWRPTPLVRARRLEKFLDTPAKIYFKNESVSPPGSHKPNTAIAQAYYNKISGTGRLTTETGAGQWGSSLAFACGYFGIECVIYMVKVSYEQKPYRRGMMKTWGGTVYASPSERTQAGRKILAADPNSQGSLGIAISEAVEDAVTSTNTKYSLGSVANHVVLHQSIIGLEAKKQMAMAGDYPDVVIGCHGGGSNFAGISFPFLSDNITEGKTTRFVAAEPSACPTLTAGEFVYDFGDTVGMTPLYKMYSLGHSFMPSGIHAGGLRYHGASPLVSSALKHKQIEAMALQQMECFDAAVTFARTEGIIPAPETSHAIRAAIIEANKCRETGESKTILFNLSGHGHVDMFSYEKYFSGEMEDFQLPGEEIQKALAGLPLRA